VEGYSLDLDWIGREREWRTDFCECGCWGRAHEEVVVSRFNPLTGFNDFLSFDAVGNVTDLCAQLAA